MAKKMSKPLLHTFGVADMFLLRDLTLHLCSSTTVPVVSTPRSLDLAHLRTALWFHQKERLGQFITIAESRRMAEREVGIPVWTST